VNRWLVCFAGCILFGGSTFAGLLPFPITAGNRGLVTCIEGSPQVTYDVYLPPSYTTTGTPLPIIYTLYANGGGMVGYFSNICANLKVICIGITDFSNGEPTDSLYRDFYEISRDIRRRLNFDPTGEFVGGFSGGGDVSYDFCRYRAQHVAGVLAMSGWMGRTFGINGTVVYYGTDRVLTNLLVARTTGSSDAATQLGFLGPDGSYLDSCGAIVQDWTFPGGHAVPPDSLKTTALTWLLNNRIPAGPTDQSNAVAQAASWRLRMAAGQTNAVLRECVNALMNQPRSWMALEAELVMDDMTSAYSIFRSLAVTNLAEGDLVAELFYYQAIGAADSGILSRYRSFMKALTGVTGVTGDRAGDIYSLLQRFGYPVPTLHCSAGQNPGQATLWVSEDAPGLTYAVQSRSDLMNDAWQDVSPPFVDTNALWSAEIGTPPGGRGFYRTSVSPTPGTSPPPHQ
jgi:predicted esterase